MSTLLIGDKGYIGTELMKVIEADGYDSGHDHWQDSEWKIEGYDNIVLLAGHSSMQLGASDPVGCWENNVVKFKKLLDGLRDDQKLIYASSGSVYNAIKSHPDEECVEFHPFNMYDLSKYTIDQLAKLSGKHTYGLRLCTVNGFSDTLRADLMLNKMVESAKAGQVIIKNGDLERPISDIKDVVRIIKMMVESTEDHRGLYNVRSLKGHTVRDFAEAVVKKFGGEVVDQGNEPAYVYGADTTKLEQTYGFKFEGTLDSILESLKQEPKQKVIRA